MNISTLFVRLQADVTDLDRKLKHAQKSMATTGSSMEGLGKKLAIGLAAAFSVAKITAFGQASVREAAAAGAVWNRLGGTLQTVGVEFESVRGNIERAARAMEAATTVGDEQFAETLQTLVRITGDYNASLAEVTTVANLAAGAQIDLNTAAQLVGKVMVGETGTLKRYGIVVEEGADAMQLLRDRFRGMAQNEANTLQGKVIQLSNAWGNFKEAIGDALTEAGNGPSVLDKLIGAVRGMTGWIEDNADSIKVWGDAFAGVATRIGWVIDKLARLDKLANAPGIALKAAAERGASLARERNPMLFGDGSGPAGSTIRSASSGSGRGRGVGPVGSGVRTPTEEELAAAEAAATAAAERLARELEEAAERTREMNRAWADSIQAQLDAAQYIRDAKFDKLAESSRALERELRDAAERSAAGSFAKSTLSKEQKAALVNPELDPSLLGAFEAQITGLAASFGPLAIAAAVLAPVMEGLAPAFEILKEPLRIFGQLIGLVITPLLERIAVPLRLAVKAYSFFVEALGNVIVGLGKLIDVLPFISGSKIIKAGQEMVDGARAARRALDGAADAADRLADSMTTNLPQGFRTVSLQLAQFASSTPRASTAPRGIGGSGSSVTVNDGRQATIIINEAPGSDGTFRRKVMDAVRQGLRQDGLLFEGDPNAYLPALG